MFANHMVLQRGPQPAVNGVPINTESNIVTILFLYIAQCALQLSTMFANHMVLQRGPQRAVIWGTADTEGDTVTVTATMTGDTQRVNVSLA